MHTLTKKPLVETEGSMETQALTPELSLNERDEFHKLFEKRLENVKAKTADVFAFRKVERPPFIVNSALYTAFGMVPETFLYREIPELRFSGGELRGCCCSEGKI